MYNNFITKVTLYAHQVQEKLRSLWELLQDNFPTNYLLISHNADIHTHSPLIQAYKLTLSTLSPLFRDAFK